MCLNRWDFYGSEETGLQIMMLREVVSITQKFRGKGDIRYAAECVDEIESGEFFALQLLDENRLWREGVWRREGGMGLYCRD